MTDGDTRADVTDEPAASTATTAPTDPAPASPLRWWKEMLIAVGFYLVYSLVRNQFGSGGVGDRDIALNHAKAIIHIERSVGLWFEPRLQQWYLDLPYHGFIRIWNVYYGSLHFIVTIGVLVLAFRRIPFRYPYYRTMLAGATALAIVGFATFSLMPPRLLDESTSEFGGCYRTAVCHEYGFVDTLAVHGGLWEFGSGGMSKVSNQYAAMPSLHFGWSSWCAITFMACYRRKRWRWWALAYPAATLFCILITANHFWFDALGGVAVLLGGWAIAELFDRIKRWWRNRDRTPADAAGTSAPATT